MTEQPATRGSRTSRIALEIVIERQTCTTLGRTRGTEGSIGHRDSGTVSVIAEALCINVIVRSRLQVVDYQTFRMIHNGIQEIVISRFLLLGQFAVREEHTVAVLIALPANDSHVLTYGVHRERRDRTAERNEIHRDLGDIGIVGSTEVTEEHDVRTKITHIVTFVVLKTYAERIPSVLTEIEGIQGYEGTQVGRIGDDTDDDLVVIRGRVIATRPEIDLVLRDIIHIQLRHDSVRTDVRSRGGRIRVVELEVVPAIMHGRRACLYIGDIVRGSFLRLATYYPAGHLTALTYGIAFIFRESDGTQGFGSHCLTRCIERHRSPLRGDRVATKGSSRYIVLGLTFQTIHFDGVLIRGVTGDDPRLRHHIAVVRQILLAHEMIGHEQYPVIAGTETTADTYAGGCQIRDTRFRHRARIGHKRYIIDINPVSFAVTGTPSYILGSRRYEGCIFAEVNGLLIEVRGTRSRHRIQRHEGTEIRRVGHYTPYAYLIIITTHREGDNDGLQRVTLDLRRSSPVRCRAGTLIDIQSLLRVHCIDIRQRTGTGSGTQRPTVRIIALPCGIGLEGLFVRLRRIEQLTGGIYIKRYPRVLIAGSTHVEVIVLLRSQLVFIEMLTGHDRIRYDIVSVIIGIILNLRDRNGLAQQFHLPGIVIRYTAPGHVDRVRRRMIQLQVEGFDTRRILQLYIVNQDVATHEEVGSQTRGDSQLIMLQLIVREDETRLLEGRTTYAKRIKRHEGVLIGDIAHRTDDHHSLRRRRSGNGTYIEGKQHIRQRTLHNRQDSYRTVGSTRRIELERLIAIHGRTRLIDTRIIHAQIVR